MTDSDEIDELREQTRGTDRISADAGDEEVRKDEETEEDEAVEEDESEAEEHEETSDSGARNLPAPSEGFETVFEERAGRTKSGIDPRSVSATDPDLSALLLALQETEELEDVGGSIAEELGAPEPPVYDRDAVVRLAVAYALKETAPEYFKLLANRV
jgi:hypothetical protein